MKEVNGIQISVKFGKKCISTHFESSNKKKVDWDEYTDEQYIWMMKEALTCISNTLRDYRNLAKNE